MDADALTPGRSTLESIYKDALGNYASKREFLWKHRGGFVHFVLQGIENGSLDNRLGRKNFKLGKLSYALNPELDSQLDSAQLQELADKYLLRQNGAVIETPQYFCMRKAMERALHADNPTRTALEYYEAISNNLEELL